MKALSVKLPWADLIAQGEKMFEIRTWATKHRGPLLICASKNPDGHNAGHALCVVTLADVRPMRRTDAKNARAKYQSNLKSWILKNVHPIKPFPVVGRPGLFDIFPIDL